MLCYAKCSEWAIAMFTEDVTSRDFPAPAPRHLPIPLRQLARQIVPAGSSTALPARQDEGNRSVDVGPIADGRHAVRLFFVFDKSTHSRWNTTAPLLPRDLEEALDDLRATPREAVEKGYSAPTQLALTNAERILRQMYALSPIRLEVYPTPDGEVAIVAPCATRCSVMVLCDSNGGALCTVNMDGEHRRARYSTAASLPDGFLRDAMSELAHRGG